MLTTLGLNRKRPMGLYLEAVGKLYSTATLEEKRKKCQAPQVSVTLYSCVRFLRGLLLGLTLCRGFSSKYESFGLGADAVSSFRFLVSSFRSPRIPQLTYVARQRGANLK
jgi:hypothetical protein